MDGNSISWSNWGVKSYTTNFGQVIIDDKTNLIKECCIGLGKNQPNSEISVKIFDGEFQVLKETFYTVYSELYSKKFPYPVKTCPTLPIVEILEILQKDNNDSIAAVTVKKQLTMLVFQKLSVEFGKKELIALRELLKSWRKPILKREPIIQRTPIRR